MPQTPTARELQMTFKEMQAEARKIRVQRGSVSALEYIQAWFATKRAAEKIDPRVITR